MNTSLTERLVVNQNNLLNLIRANKSDYGLKSINIQAWLFEFGVGGSDVFAFAEAGEVKWSFMTLGICYELALTANLVNEGIGDLAMIRLPILTSDNFVLTTPLEFIRDYNSPNVTIYEREGIQVTQILPKLLNFNEKSKSIRIYNDALDHSIGQFMLKSE